MQRSRTCFPLSTSGELFVKPGYVSILAIWLASAINISKEKTKRYSTRERGPQNESTALQGLPRYPGMRLSLRLAEDLSLQPTQFLWVLALPSKDALITIWFLGRLITENVLALWPSMLSLLIIFYFKLIGSQSGASLRRYLPGTLFDPVLSSWCAGDEPGCGVERSWQYPAQALCAQPCFSGPSMLFEREPGRGRQREREWEHVQWKHGWTTFTPR